MTRQRGGFAWMRRGVLLGAGLMWGCQAPEAALEPDVSGDGVETPEPIPVGPLPPSPPPVPPEPAPEPGPKPPADSSPRLDARRTWWRASYNAGTSPESLVVEDFDGDGAPDVVIGARGSASSGRYYSQQGSLRVLRNDGRGGLNNTPSTLQKLPGPSGSLATGDANADGRMDVLVGSEGQTQLLLGEGGGVLRAPDSTQRLGWMQTTSTGVWKGSQGPALLWSLGVLREVIWDYEPPQLYFAHLLADGTLQKWNPLPEPFVLREPSVPYGGLRAVVADFNEDGLPDVVFSHEQSVPDTKAQARVFLGENSGQLVPGSSLAPLQHFQRLLTADFNRDGHQDLLALYVDARSVGVLLGAGDGTFSAQPTVTLAHPVSQVAVVALDADGLPDVVALHAEQAAASLLRGRGEGRFESRGLLAVGRWPSEAASADLDGDGRPELLVLENDDNTVSVYQPPDVTQTELIPLVSCPLNPRWGDPAPLSPVSPVVRLPLSGVEEGAVGDFDADGRMDLMLTLAEGGLRLLPHAPEGRFVPRDVEAVRGWPLSEPAAGDFDGDGRLDLAVVRASNGQDPSHGSGVYVLWNDARDVFSWSEPRAAWRDEFGLLAGDFNGDGLADLAMTTVDGGGGDANVAMSLSARQFRVARLPNYNAPSHDEWTYTYKPLAAADFNGDGTRDLIHLSSRGINLNPMAKAGTTLPGQGFYYWNWELKFVAAGDADGDGVADLILNTSASASAHPVEFWRGDGFGSLQAPMDCALPRGKQLIDWKDMNADGLADAVALEDNGRGVTLWVMLRAPGGRWGTVRPQVLEAAPKWVLPVDLMGDARPELAVLTKTGELLVFPPMGP